MGYSIRVRHLLLTWVGSYISYAVRGSNRSSALYFNAEIALGNVDCWCISTLETIGVPKSCILQSKWQSGVLVNGNHYIVLWIPLSVCLSSLIGVSELRLASQH